MTVCDLVEAQGDYKAHCVQFTLWPRRWEEYSDSWDLEWRVCRLIDEQRGCIPDESGIYTLLIQPGIASHPACSYLVYVGQTKSLRRRFGEYLGKEGGEKGRPKLVGLLYRYAEHIWFCFSLLSEDELDEAEEALRTSYIPPANTRLSAQINKVTGAF